MLLVEGHTRTAVVYKNALLVLTVLQLLSAGRRG